MTELSAATGKLLALSMLKGIGPSTLRKMAASANFETLSNDKLAVQFPNVAHALQDSVAWSKALGEAEVQAEEAARIGARILSAIDPDYPRLLAATKDDPFIIWVRGSLHSHPDKYVAVIGTREPTAHGQVIAERVTQYFVEQQWSIVSGLALGCDAVAHRAALSSAGHTVAVLAHGLQTVAPSRHRKLADEILDSGGALVSEYRIGQEPAPQQFAKRDRTQAGMAQGVVMVQSDLTGGSLHASRAALDYRRWLAVPYPTELDRASTQPKIQANLLIADGSAEERTELLRCSASALSSVHILRSKDDYQKLTQRVVVAEPALPPSQGSLI